MVFSPSISTELPPVLDSILTELVTFWAEAIGELAATSRRESGAARRRTDLFIVAVVNQFLGGDARGKGVVWI